VVFLTLSFASQVSAKTLRMPGFVLPADAPPEYRDAVDLVLKYGNSDEFYAYMLKKRTYFTHTELNVREAISEFREQLADGGDSRVVFHTPQKGTLLSDAYAVWDGSRIIENTKIKLSVTERAGVLMHETSHKYGWLHKGNDRDKFNNINSFPYAVGKDFQAFLEMKVRKKQIVLTPQRQVIKAQVTSKTLSKKSMGRKTTTKTINDLIRRCVPEFKQCYQSVLSTHNNPELFKGTANIQFSILKSGRILNAKIESGNVKSDNLQACISNVLRKIQFPLPKYGIPLKVRQPINFSPKESPVI
jgi:hypothetical protein